MKESVLKDLVESGTSRREFARRMMAAGVTISAAGLIDGASSKAEAQSITDIDILNFALNLEYLEAEFYTVATTGMRIADVGIEVGGTGAMGPTTGGGMVALSGLLLETARSLANEEQMHVRFLRAALGSAAVAKPAINLEALGLGFRNQTEFLTLSRAFEDVGVTAYNGAAPLIRSSAILSAAASIALTEAQHAGVLRYIVANNSLAVPQLDMVDVPPLGSPQGRLFNVFNEGLTPARTPSQVLAIVYANNNSGARQGGFFPSGFNGLISQV